MRRDSTVEIHAPPLYYYGARVVSRKNVRNDGTFPGKEIGEILVKKGDAGYVASIGTFLQQYYIYGVDFPERGYVVGMKAKELLSAQSAGGEGE
jgi:nitrogen fixation protein NifZ